jgi:hypothetical protein
MRGLPWNNFPAFDKAGAVWRSRGHQVYNPADADRLEGFDGSQEPTDRELITMMVRDVSELLSADALVLLAGWEHSRLGRVEVALSQALNKPKPLFNDETGLLVCVPKGQSLPAPQKRADESVLDIAKHLVRGPRRQSYGHPAEDYGRTARMWSAILGVDVSPAQAILCMVAVKMSRECHEPGRENRVDMAGYVECLDLVSRRADETVGGS